jgi:hypothetical protein
LRSCTSRLRYSDREHCCPVHVGAGLRANTNTVQHCLEQQLSKPLTPPAAGQAVRRERTAVWNARSVFLQ